MNLSKLISRSTFLLLVAVFLVSCDRDSNVTSGVDATGQSEVEGAVEDETPLEEGTSQEVENVTTDEVADDTDKLLGQNRYY